MEVLSNGLILMVTALGCTGADRRDATTAGVSIEDSAGVRVVVSGASQWRPGEGWRASAEPVTTLGALDGPAAYEFYDVRGLTRLNDGSIVVLDASSAQVRGFSSSGEHLWTFGSRGQGPGEMRKPTHLERVRGDTLQVQDGLSRLRFTPGEGLIDHDVLDLARLRQMARIYTGEACRGMPTFVGDYIVGCWTTTEPSPLQIDRPWLRTVGVARLSWSLDDVDTVGVFFVDEGWTIGYPRGPLGHARAIVAPLGPKGILRLSGRAPLILHARTDAYRIEMYRLADASLAQVIERRIPRRAWTEREIAVELQWGRNRFNPPELRGSLADYDRLPVVDSLSIAIDFLVDELGFLWVRRGPSERGDGIIKEIAAPDGTLFTALLSSGLHDVFAPDGAYLGTVQLPHDLEVFEIGADYVLGVVRDLLGVEYVHVHALDRTGSHGR